MAGMEGARLLGVFVQNGRERLAVRALSSQARRPRPKASVASAVRRRPRRVDDIAPFGWLHSADNVLEQGGVVLSRPAGIPLEKHAQEDGHNARPHPQLPPLPLELKLGSICRVPREAGSPQSGSKSDCHGTRTSTGTFRASATAPSAELSCLAPASYACTIRPRPLCALSGDEDVLSLAHTIQAQSFWHELDESEREQYVLQAATAAKAYNQEVFKFYARPPAEDKANSASALERWVAKRLSLNSRLTMRKIIGAIVEGQSRGFKPPSADRHERGPEHDGAEAATQVDGKR